MKSTTSPNMLAKYASARTAVLALSALSALLVGCTTPPATKTPVLALPGAFSQTQATASMARLDGDWWRLFADPALDALVDAAAKNNLDLRLAVLRVDETMAVLGLTQAARLPSLDAGAGFTQSRSSALTGLAGGGVETSSHRLALSTSFEVDLWGKLRNANAAAQAQLVASGHALDVVHMALVSGTAQAYFGLRSLDALIALNAQAQTSRRQMLDIVQRRADGGVASPLEVAQSRAALAAVATQAPELQRQRGLLENQLAALTGQHGQRVAAVATALPHPLVPPAGLPSQLLARRPDIAQAEAQLRAAQIQIEVARSAMWPSLSLTASFGAQSNDLLNLLNAGARIWSIGPSLLLPLFDGGRTKARTDQARAQAEQAAVAYAKAAQLAFQQTADALVQAEQGAAQEAAAAQQRVAAVEVQRVAKWRYEAGYSGYLEVLDAERGLQDAEAGLLRARALRLDASVGLIKALGGGWTATSR